MKSSELLTRAKRHLYVDKNDDYRISKSQFVCVSILIALQDTNDAISAFNPPSKRRAAKVDEKLADRLTDEITGRLHGKQSVRDWLIAQGHATEEQVHDYSTMQAYRHRWLDSLVQEYQAKGD